MKTYYTGTRGTVKYDGGQFYDVTNWELNAELQPVDTTTLGDSAPVYRYARPIYNGRLDIIPANDKTRDTDAKQITSDLFRTTISSSSAIHELTLITGDNSTYAVIRCNAVFSDVQFLNGIDGRPSLSVGFVVSGLLQDYNWDSTLALPVEAGAFALTMQPITFRYFALNLATRNLVLTMQPIDLRYFAAELTTLSINATLNPLVLISPFALVETGVFTVTANDVTFELA